MKKILLLLLLLFTVKEAYSFQYGYYTYEIIDDELKTCKSTGVGAISGDASFSELYIPDYVIFNDEQYAVIEISGSYSSIDWRIKTITIGNNVRKIGDGAFRYFDKVTELTFGNSVEEIGAKAFADCWYLSDVNIPDNVKFIGESAFEHNYKSYAQYRTINIGKGVIEVGAKAFYPNGNAIRIYIPSDNSLEKIGDYAFYGGGADFLNLPNIKEIGEQAFAGTSATTLTLGESIESIGSYAFYNSKIQNLNIPGNLQTISDYAFYNCKNLSSITLNDGLNEICEGAFNNCSQLKEITIPGTVLQIGTKAFEGCTNLSSITINTGVKIIEESAFRNTAVQSIEIPRSVKTLGNSVFNGCTSLYSVILGKGLNNIGSSVFTGCTKLLSVTSLNSTPPVIEGATFEKTTTSSGKLFVPKGSESKYYSANYWLEFKSITGIEVEDDNPSTPGVSPSDITATVLMVPDEDRDFSEMLPAGVTASTWESSDEDVAEVNRKGRVDAWEFGRAYVTAKDASGNSVALFEVLVCPTVSVEHGDGVIYSHHVVYNSYPTLSLNPGKGYKIAGVTHDGVDVTESLVGQDGKYVPTEPITANSVINLALAEHTDGPTTGTDTVWSDSDIRIYVEGHHVRIVGAPAGSYVTMTNLQGKRLFYDKVYEIDVFDCGVYLVTIEGQTFKILVQ